MHGGNQTLIHLREITLDNWETCISLKTTPEQSRFVAANVYSLAESKFQKQLVPLAIYAGETMVGFVMYGLDPDDNNYWIYRLMIDANHQRRGYGRAALVQVIKRLNQTEGCDKIVIGYKPENVQADILYASLGFEKTGEMLFGELIAELNL
jgi:diamine N-acetyltransferase